MQTRTKLLSVIFAALALGAGAALASSDDSVVAGESIAAPALKWQVGSKQRYGLDLRSEIEIRGAAEAHYVHQLGGALDIQVFSVTSDVVRIGCQLSNIDQSIDGEARNEPLLSSFFVATATVEGRFTGFQFPKTLGGEMQNRLREMMRMFQVIVPLGSTTTWTTDEEDANGRFIAVYRVANAGEIRKARVRYTTEDAKILSSKTTARLSLDGSWVEELATDEKQCVRSPEGLVITSSVSGRLRRIAGPAAWRGDLVAALSQAETAVADVQRAIEAQRRRPVTAADRRRFRALVIELDEAGKLGNGLLDALRDAMLECPELALSIPGLVAAGDLKDLTASTLIHALRLAGHTEAQQSLTTIAKDSRQTRQNRMRAIIDLGGVARPNDAACTDLWQLSLSRHSDPGLATTAMLALGRIGKSLREINATRYDAMRGQMVQTLDTASDASERSTVLTAMGNTGDAALVENVAAHLGGPDTQVRAAAAKALGRLGGAKNRILACLATERSANVRRQLVESLCAQSDATVASLSRIDTMIAGEQDDQTRFAMARYLGTNMAKTPTSRATLRELLGRETNNRIRKYIAGIVYARR